MRSAAPNRPAVRGNLLPRSLLVAAAVAQRAGLVAGLLNQRRKLALAYRRTQREDQRMALERIDTDLAQHNINIPAIQRLTHRQ